MCFMTTAEACLTVALEGMQKKGLNLSLAEIDSYAKFELVIPSKYDKPTIDSDFPPFKKAMRSLPDMACDSREKDRTGSRKMEASSLFGFIINPDLSCVFGKPNFGA
jgi:hypothetical protein